MGEPFPVLVRTQHGAVVTNEKKTKIKKTCIFEHGARINFSRQTFCPSEKGKKGKKSRQTNKQTHGSTVCWKEKAASTSFSFSSSFFSLLFTHYTRTRARSKSLRTDRATSSLAPAVMETRPLVQRRMVPRRHVIRRATLSVTVMACYPQRAQKNHHKEYERVTF